MSPALPLTGFLSIFAVALGAPGWLLWSLPFVFYGIVPLFDWALGEDVVNAPESAVGRLDQDRYYSRIVYAYIPSQYLATIAGAWLSVQGTLDVVSLIGLLVAVGMVNGVGINTAHELGHKTNVLERWLAKITLAPVAYGHFFIEHNKGHHKNVATFDDPASSRMGESFWAFWPRTVVGSLKSAWGIERERLERKGQPVWSHHNENLQAWSMTVVLFAALTVWLGPWALVFLIAQAIYGFSLLEVVNYLEHYGLLRLKDSSGRVERCQPRHSWNSNHIVTNLFLYQLQRHSDHHANPTRRYQGLRHFEDSPQLPSGYAAMILIAYLPPLWYRLMDPKVVAHHGGDLRLANLQPSRREALLRRWPCKTDVLVPTGNAQPGALPTNAAANAKHQCPNCSYVYDPAKGHPGEGYAPGTSWLSLPGNWPCPHCAVREKQDFVVMH
ncbi:MAG: fatty acid desaturase [Stagnimonas sp.]|nr:fatty acid desaturase [Stagnimonas sp.]